MPRHTRGGLQDPVRHDRFVVVNDTIVCLGVLISPCIRYVVGISFGGTRIEGKPRKSRDGAFGVDMGDRSCGEH